MRYLALALLCIGTVVYAGGKTKPAAPDCSSGTQRPLSSDQAAALASFQALLDGLGKRDKTAMMAQLLPGGSAVLMRNGKPAQMTFEMLADRLSQPGPASHEERIHDAIVHVDGDVATVWAPFEFLVDGKIDHCGRDIANLVQVDGHWIIAAIEDNGRKDCGA